MFSNDSTGQHNMVTAYGNDDQGDRFPLFLLLTSTSKATFWGIM